MRAETTGAIPRRPPFPGAAFELSTLAFTVGAARSPLEAELATEALRRARRAGVTTFDTADSPDPAVADALLAKAFPEGDPQIVVLSPRGDGQRLGGRLPRAGAPPGRPPGPEPVDPRELSVDAPLRHLIEVTSGHATGPRAGARGGRSVGAEPRDTAVVVRCQDQEDLDRIPASPAPRLVSGPLSLLRPGFGASAARRWGPEGFSWIARDPFADGRLDGSRFAPTPPGVGSSGLRSVRELEAEFAEVARFGFLARSRQRTLAQAALRYLVDLPWVATVVTSIPPPERWEEIVGFASSLSLDVRERARVDELTGLGPAPRAPGGGAP